MGARVLFPDAEGVKLANRQYPCGFQRTGFLWRHTGDINCLCAPPARRWSLGDTFPPALVPREPGRGTGAAGQAVCQPSGLAVFSAVFRQLPSCARESVFMHLSGRF